MRSFFLAAACAALTAVILFPSPSSAQTKTVKQCQDEWRANKANNVAKGIKEKDYVTQCRGAPTPVAAPKAAPAVPPPAGPKTGKTAKECGAEWTANKAENEAKGLTKKQYVAQCRTGAARGRTDAGPSPARAFCSRPEAEDNDHQRTPAPCTYSADWSRPIPHRG